MADSSRGMSETVQRADPWAGAQPFLTDVMNQASSQFRNPASTVAQFAPETVLAQNAAAARALSGSPLDRAAGGQLRQTLGGDFLGAGNPYFGEVSQAVRAQVEPNVAAQFSRAGRSFSPAHAGTLGAGITNALAPFAFGQYGEERQNQLRAAALAPSIAGQDYADIGALANVGAQREGRQQSALDEPMRRLREYAALIGSGNVGGTTTTTAPYFNPSPLSQGLGAASSLGGLGLLLGLF